MQVFFIDDGVSGVTFDRPNLNRMIAEIEAGNVATVIVKYMSQLGRDYLKVGYYTEIFFVERDVRYIAINDGVDSAKDDNDFTPFRNLFNDFYAKDTSKKVRAIKRAQGQAGEHLTKHTTQRKREIRFPTIPMNGKIVPLLVFWSIWTTAGIR